MSEGRSVLDPEEIPDEDPDEDPEYEPDDAPVGPSTLTTSVHANNGGGGDREYEYRSEMLSIEEVADGHTLVDRLNAGTADGWHLVDVIDAGDKRLLLLRKVRKSERVHRTVGFAPPGRS
ncbi:MAG: hypothetical protein NVS9B1_21450 [Candidatus Dormibacteraceae bacterium]